MPVCNTLRAIPVSSLAAGLAFVTVPAFAQDRSAASTQAADAQTAADVDQADEDIIVTATLRSERLQDVPVAVTAISGEVLTDTRLTDIRNVTLLVPTVTFNSNSQPNSFSFGIRGVQTIGNTYTTEQSVALVVDGIVMGVPGQGIGELADIERLEVLRGPQGMLFGKNASAGVIQVVTADPRLGVWEGSASASYASFNERKLRASVNIPISSTLAARVSGFTRDRDGYVYNIVRNESVNDDQGAGVRGKLLWQPSDAFRAVAIGDYATTDSKCCVSTLGGLAAAPLVSPLQNELLALGIVPGRRNLVAGNNSPWFNRSMNFGGSLQASYQVGGFDIVSITGYRKYSVFVRSDTDISPYPGTGVAAPTGRQRASQFSQELRLTSPVGETLEYVLGLYYYDKAVRSPGVNVGCSINPAAGSRPTPLASCVPGSPFFFGNYSFLGLDNSSEAVFGQATLNLGERLRLIAGGRYTWEHYRLQNSTSQFVGQLEPGFGPILTLPLGSPVSSASGKADNRNFSWRLGAQFDISNDAMTYFTVARGYKGPSPRNDSPTSVALTEAEIPTSYELGLKSQFFAKRVTLNVALFDAKFRDFQATAFDFNLTPPATIVTNAGKLRSRGVEVEASGRIADGLRLNANVAYLDATYLSFRGDQCYLGQTVAEGCNFAIGTSGARVNNSTGNRLANAPKWAYSAIGSYQRPLNDRLSLFANANYSYKGAVFFTSANSPFLQQDGYGVVGASLGVGGTDERWRVSVFARNLFDKYYVGRLQDAGGLGGQRGNVQVYGDPEARRYLGAAIDVRFGS